MNEKNLRQAADPDFQEEVDRRDRYEFGLRIRLGQLQKQQEAARRQGDAETLSRLIEEFDQVVRQMNSR